MWPQEAVDGIFSRHESKAKERERREREREEIEKKRKEYYETIWRHKWRDWKAWYIGFNLNLKK